MDNPVGTIRTIDNGLDEYRVTVAVDVSVACARCAAGKGCGAGIFSGRERTRTVAAVADQSLTLAVGDTVQLQLTETSLLSAAAIVYGIPLAGALGAAALAYGVRLGDAAAAAAALGGLGLGVLVGRWWLARPNCLNRFVPRVQERL